MTLWKIFAVDTQFKQLRKRSLKKIQASAGFEPVTSAIPVQCSTNWDLLKKAIKPVQEAEAANLTVSHETIQIDESQSETSADKPVASNVPIVIKPSTSVVQPAHCTCNQKMEKIIADMEDLKQIVFNIPAITKDQQTNMQIELDRLKRENESLITTIKVLSTQLSQRERPVSSDSALEDANIPKQVETHPPLIEIPDEQTSKVNQSKTKPSK